MNCRFCGKTLTHEFIDLVNAPPSNAFLIKDQLNEPEVFYPLKLFVCDSCFLVQIDEYKKSSDIFNSGYVYFSSFSRTWLEHAKQYTDMMIEKYGYDQNSLIIEIASNDGYLLQYFKEREIPSLGIEPAEGPAVEAKKKGIETIVDFFGGRLAKSLADQGKKADLLIGNNVLAHVPNLHDFVAGLKIALKPSGIITMEFPHLMQLVDNCQFDTIYHEHFSYLSFTTIQSIFNHHGLELFDVEERPTHGGSLRVFAQHSETGKHPRSARVDELLQNEAQAGMFTVDYYAGFQARADKVKNDFLTFLLEAKQQGKTVAAYGAAAKGNTLLNYAGVHPDLLPYVVDRNPAKQGKYLPGSRILISSEARIRNEKPHFVLILPWNIKEEVMAQLAYIREWGGKFVTAVPELRVES